MMTLIFIFDERSGQVQVKTQNFEFQFLIIPILFSFVLRFQKCNFLTWTIRNAKNTIQKSDVITLLSYGAIAQPEIKILASNCVH